VEVKAIQGGNVNYAFCIVLQDGKTIFLKQVSPHKKTGGHIGTRLYFAMKQFTSPEIPSLLNDNRHRNLLPFLVPMVFH
jgi:5-methylthioribose kinase